MRIALVSNPNSGSHDPATIAEVAEKLMLLGEVVDIRPTDRASIGADIADVDPDAVIAAGGDGTFNDVLNAVPTDEVTFGIVPLGTGNDLVRTLGLSEDPLEAAADLARGLTTEMDIGRARSGAVNRLFANGCMGGFPVQMNKEVDEDLKRRLGPLAFWLGGLKAAADLVRFEVRLGDLRCEEVLAVGIGNGRTAGGGIPMWPTAEVHDGLLDGVALGAGGAGSAAALAARVRAGKHERTDGVTSLRAESIEVTADPQMEFNMDGELPGLVTPVSFEAAGTIRILCPSTPTP